MKRMVIFFSIFFYSNVLLSQKKISLPKYFEGDGVIFDQEQAKKFNIYQIDTFITPTLDQIESFESTLRFLNRSSSALKKYNRQYIGFIRNNSEYLMIYLMNFKNKRLAKEYFNNYEKEVILGLGEFYERNAILYKFNIQDKTIGSW